MHCETVEYRKHIDKLVPYKASTCPVLCLSGFSSRRLFDCFLGRWCRKCLIVG